jgi:transcription antitermination factor NusG
MAEAWYVLRSKPNKENFLWGQILAHQVEVFYPAIRVKVVNPRARKIKPYFPGYLFVRVDTSQLSRSFWQWLPGACGLVSFSDTPAVVPEVMIDAIRRKVEEINNAGSEALVGLQRGDPVRIQSGPFVEYDAIFDGCISGSDRVRVLLKHLQNRQIRVILPVEQIVKQKRSAGWLR